MKKIEFYLIEFVIETIKNDKNVMKIIVITLQ